MGMSISSSRASTAILSQPVGPQAPILAQPIPPANDGTQSIDAIASELLALNTDGSRGRNVNQVA